MIRLSLCALIFISTLVHADDGCSTINLPEQPNSPFNSIPIYDQDGSGTCYAYLDAQLADYYFQKTGQKELGRVNPLYMAWIASRSQAGKKILESGDYRTPLEELRKHGLCKDTDVQKAMHELEVAGQIGTDAQAMSFLDHAYELYGQSKSEPSEVQWERVDPNGNLKNCSLHSASVWMQSKGFAGLSSIAVLDSLLSSCATHAVKLPKFHLTEPKDNIGDVIDRSLKKGMPVGAAFDCFYDFSEHPGQAKARSPSWFNKLTGTFPSCKDRHDDMHGAMIVAQKKIKGECHYLIRNSFGSLWEGMGATGCSCIFGDWTAGDDCGDHDNVRSFTGCWYKKTDVLRNVTNTISFE